MNKPFHLLIKPAASDCNLRCAYCFYAGRAALYPESRTHRMSPVVLERLVSGYMATVQPQYVFIWQGGEPTLMGVDFFRRSVELQVRYGRPGSVVANGMQTNALLIDDEFARFLSEHRFLLGVSLDGPEGIHDAHRRRAGGGGSHADVVRSIARLEEHGVAFNVLTLVSDANVGRALDVYRYLRDKGFRYHQYIECVEFGPDGAPMPFAVRPGQWGEFLCAIFDEWLRYDVSGVSVRLFDSILAYLAEGRRTVCTMGEDCRRYYLVEHNGDVYPCDFFVKPELRLGNIMHDPLEDIGASRVYLDFGRSKSRLPRTCLECELLDLCRGDCQRNRRVVPKGKVAESWLCEGWRMFYRHAVPRLKDVGAKLVKGGKR